MPDNLNNEQIEVIVDKVMKKVWEKISYYGLIIIFALVMINLQMNTSKADEVATITPKEFVETVVAVPGQVVAGVQNEWSDIKVYQAQSWADMKAQFVSTKEKITNLFVSK